MKTPDFKSYQQGFSPSTMVLIDFAELEVEYTFPGSMGQPVSDSKFPGRNKSIKTGSNCVQTICKRNNSVVQNIQATRFEKQMFWKTWSQRISWNYFHTMTLPTPSRGPPFPNHYNTTIKHMQSLNGLLRILTKISACGPMRICYVNEWIWAKLIRCFMHFVRKKKTAFPFSEENRW